MRSLLVSALLLAGCASTHGPAASGSAQTSTRDVSSAPRQAAPPSGADQRRAALDGLRATHPGWREENPCTTDNNCDGALRCEKGRCGFPGGMTGAHDDNTPMAIVSGSRGDARYFLEVADDDDEHTRGLMFRKVLKPDFGMVFIFPDEAKRAFWMRNTLIPLDMLFVRADGTIDSIVENAEPLTLTPRPSAGPAKYVVELNGGDAKAHGFAAGQHVEFLNLALPSAAH